MGLYGWGRDFIAGYAVIARPISEPNMGTTVANWMKGTLHRS